MNWERIESLDTLDKIVEESKQSPVIIFKHSTSCSISAMALNRLERSWNQDEMREVRPYYLDLISHRDVSDAVAAKFGIMHQSPQILLIKNGDCVYDESHMGISYQNLKSGVAA
ncbi:bacillithiol system redox-active protein YtxJ [Marivirga harenae]|uniref:bacillithiol system redox-active protein YtxJ n=1 Tax=Marivirga harenae TaxID=2010992 RepID=UPI0026DF8E35|nr:bacillithiol system redox-active protein YtxJ [Marivirga harenae]WKV13655.1 bacillithiol system redox-active protein YtxJ [Marivirga harenae]|tara:strand:+ start:23865 stop:24206 length:342 start_codon:yes stop_codon:yes gene_type:complete